MSATVPVAVIDSAAELYSRCADVFAAVVDQIGRDRLSRPTLCGVWDVRDVVNHVVAEALWVPQLLTGHTIDEVGDRFAGDLLGHDPAGSWRAADLAARAAARAVDESRPIGLSYGTVPAGEYLRQVAADHLVHAWDIASGIGFAADAPAEVVTAVSVWFDGAEDGYRAAGAIGPRIPVPDDADPRTQLLPPQLSPSTWAEMRCVRSGRSCSPSPPARPSARRPAGWRTIAPPSSGGTTGPATTPDTCEVSISSGSATGW
jgi:uncharacterized protein (TIGR03086 family)